MSTEVRKKKNGQPHHNEKVKAIAVIKVGPGVDSIRHALQSCLECNVRTIYIVDDAYTPNAPLYTEKNTAAILEQIRLRRTMVHIAPTLDLDDFEVRNTGRSKDDILMILPPDSYVTKGVVTKTIEYIHKTYKEYDLYSISLQTKLKFSLWNGLIFALFFFDWLRSLVNRFRIHENTHVKFIVLKRKLGHPIIPKGTWWGGVSRHASVFGGAGACLYPTKSGLEYFLYLIYSHAPFGVGSFLLFQLAWTLMVGFPFYNWMPVVNYWLSSVDPFGSARIFLWTIHGLVAVLITNKYFVEEGFDGQPKNLQWVHALMIPLWISFPFFPILMVYGRFLYRGYRAPPPPPDITPPKLFNPNGRPQRKKGAPPPRPEEEEEDDDSALSQEEEEEEGERPMEGPSKSKGDE